MIVIFTVQNIVLPTQTSTRKALHVQNRKVFCIEQRVLMFAEGQEISLIQEEALGGGIEIYTPDSGSHSTYTATAGEANFDNIASPFLFVGALTQWDVLGMCLLVAMKFGTSPWGLTAEIRLH